MLSKERDGSSIQMTWNVMLLVKHALCGKREHSSKLCFM
jgi:hypothetical protein